MYSLPPQHLCLDAFCYEGAPTPKPEHSLEITGQKNERLRVPGCLAGGVTRREALRRDVAERGAPARDRKAQGGGSGGRVGAMASKTAGGGRWEVVKKGRRPGAGSSGRGGGGDRRALGEANGVWKYDLTREYPPGPGPVPLGW